MGEGPPKGGGRGGEGPPKGGGRGEEGPPKEGGRGGEGPPKGGGRGRGAQDTHALSRREWEGGAHMHTETRTHTYPHWCTHAPTMYA